MKPKNASLGVFILDALFPVHCPSCQKELESASEYICDICFKKKLFFVDPQCPVCDARIPFGIVCKPCKRKTRLTRFINAETYSKKPVRDLLAAYKYDFAHIFSKSISFHMISALRHAVMNDFSILGGAYVVPIPLHSKKERQRGFNQSSLLGKIISETCNIHFEPHLLKRSRETRPQIELETHEERRKNTEGAFVVSKPLPAKRILLIDDVYTSGATMEECANILKKAGAKEIWGLVFAKG